MNLPDLIEKAGPLISTPFDKWCENFAALVRDATLEEAAALADEHKHSCYIGDNDWYEAESIACAIRQLKAQQ